MPAEDSVNRSEAPDSLTLELEMPSEVSAGEPVRFTIRLSNSAERPIHLHLLGREITFDLRITDPVGEVVWERLGGERVMAILRLETLPPGGTLELTDEWDQRTNQGEPVVPGSYSALGRIPTDQPEPLETPVVSFRIVDAG